MLCFFNHFTPVASLAGTRTGMSTGLRGFGRFITVGKSVAHPRENRMLYQIMMKQWYSRLRSFVGWSLIKAVIRITAVFYQIMIQQWYSRLRSFVGWSLIGR